MTLLLDVRETLTPVDAQTHRRYPFVVPEACRELEIRVRYSPRLIGDAVSRALAETALRQQHRRLAERLGGPRADGWAAGVAHQAAAARLANLLTASLDDALGAYRGAGHRHGGDQRLLVGEHAASPGFVPGRLPPGRWLLTLSAHTLVSAQCEVSIQIGAEIASST